MKTLWYDRVTIHGWFQKIPKLVVLARKRVGIFWNQRVGCSKHHKKNRSC